MIVVRTVSGKILFLYLRSFYQKLRLTSILFIETHDLDIEEDEDQDTRASCGGHSSNGIVDVDSGNSSSHSPSPDDTFHSINAQKCQNKRPSNGHSHCLNGSESGLQRPTSFTSGE